MGLSAGNKAEWIDMQDLYTLLRTIQDRHGYPASTSRITSNPANPNLITANTFATINNAANTTHGESCLSSRPYIQLNNPNQGAIISADLMTNLYTNIHNMDIAHCACSHCPSQCSCQGACGCDCQCSGFCEGAN